MRRQDWPERLQSVVDDAAAGRQFEWGSFDCILFAADCVAAMTGYDYASGIRGKYKTKLSAARLISRSGHESLDEIMDSLFDRIEPSIAMRGDIAMIKNVDDYAMAVVIDYRCTTPAIPRGISYSLLDDAVSAWRVQ